MKAEQAQMKHKQNQNEHQRAQVNAKQEQGLANEWR